MSDELGFQGDPSRERSMLKSLFAPLKARLEKWGCYRPAGAFRWLPVVAIFFAVKALLGRGWLPLGVYDEGVLFTDAYLLKRGLAVYRDFHFCYPPGVLQIVRAVLGLDLPAVWTVRLLAFVLRLATAVASATLVGRCRGRRFCVWTAATVLVMQEGLGLVLFAYPIALFLGLILTLTWPQPGAARYRPVFTGVLLWPDLLFSARRIRLRLQHAGRH